MPELPTSRPFHPEVALSADSVETARALDTPAMREIGNYGHSRYGFWRATVEADPLPQLRDGRRAVEGYREIRDNHPLVGAALLAVELLIRRIEWNVSPVDDSEAAEAAADFVQDCIDDLDVPWTEVISDALSATWAGASILEMTYKWRRGFDPIYTSKSSQFTDGAIGWAKFAIRHMDSVTSWIYASDSDDPLGFRQQASPDHVEKPIALAKCLHITGPGSMRNPYGHSMLRGCVIPYFFVRKLAELEGIAIEREMAGLPYALMPPEYLADDAEPAMKTTLMAVRALLAGIRRDGEESVVFPLEYDENGNKRFEIGLLTSGGTRAIDIGAVITRWEQRMVTALLSDYLMLGQGEGAGGAFALSADKTTMFKRAIETLAGAFVDEFNRKAIPQLWRLNGFDPDLMPKLTHGPVADLDLVALAQLLNQLSTAGAPIFPEDGSLLDWVYERAGLPKRSPETVAMAEVAQQATQAGSLQSLGLGPDGEPLPPDPDPEETMVAEAAAQAKGEVARQQVLQANGMDDPKAPAKPPAKAAGTPKTKRPARKP